MSKSSPMSQTGTADRPAPRATQTPENQIFVNALPLCIAMWSVLSLLISY